MNCERFEAMIVDLVRDQLDEVVEREAALRHADTCERCAARLSEERLLVGGLRALARSNTGEASARVTSALSAAMEARLAGTNGFDSRRPSHAKGIFRRNTGTSHELRWVAAAALILIAILASLLYSRSKQVPLEPRDNDIAVNSGPPAKLSGAEPIAVPPSKDNDPIQQPEERRLRTRSASPQHDQPEISTDFISLIDPEEWDHVDGEMEQLVRVRLPRSSLEMLGLPMNVERSDELIQAQVLIGIDGTPRAIRFIQ